VADGPDLTELIQAQSSYLVKALLNGSRGDTTDATARDWLSRWGASGIQPKPPACTCAEGRCRICN
jgi:hypothetical protein